MILVDTGNIFAESPLPESARVTTHWKAELILTAMERMGYEAAAIGELDLYLGLDELKALEDLTSVKLLSANLVDSNGDNVFTPYITLEKGDLTVMVLGLTKPPTRPDLAAKRIGDSYVHDPLGTASRLVPEIRKECDLLIVLSSLGHARNLELASSVEGIDIIIGGSNRRYTRQAVIRNNSLVTTGYFQGRAIGQLMISLKGPVEGWVSSKRLGYLDRQIRVAEEQAATQKNRENLTNLRLQRDREARQTIYISDMIKLDPSFPDDPEIASMVQEYKRELSRAASIPRGNISAKENPSHFTGPRACIQCHGSRHRFWAKTRHAAAYDTLARQGDGMVPDCLPCHVTGFGLASGFWTGSGREDLGGVTCESCHGIGSLHVMSPALYDLVGTPPPSTCLQCHTNERDDDFNYLRDRGSVCSEVMQGEITSEHVSE